MIQFEYSFESKKKTKNYEIASNITKLIAKNV
jgi:hypothetical protein